MGPVANLGVQIILNLPNSTVHSPRRVRRRSIEYNDNTRGVEWSIHPRGFAWLSASQAGESPTNAELENDLNWDRRFNERKQIKLAELRTNG